MLELYGVIRSRSMRPHWAMEELGLDYTFYNIDFRRGDSRHPHFLNLNPGAKIPVLVDDGFVLSESSAICTYLGDKYPEKGLTPKAGTKARARYNQWMCFIISELEQPLWNKGKHTFALPEELRVPAIIETAKWEFERAVNLLSEGLDDQNYFIDNSFTMVDIMAAHTLRWALNFEFPVTQDNLLAFLANMEARPALERVKACKVTEFPR